MTKCPCCGTLTENDVVVDLNSNQIARGDKVVKLGPQQAELLFILAAVMPAYVRSDRLAQKLYGAGEEPEGGLACVRSNLCIARKKIKPLGLNLPSRNGTGYALEFAA